MHRGRAAQLCGRDDAQNLPRGRGVGGPRSRFSTRAHIGRACFALTVTERLKSIIKKTLRYNPRRRAQEFFAALLRDLDATTMPAAQHVTSEVLVQQLTIIFC